MQIRDWKSWGMLTGSALFGLAIIASLFVAIPNSYQSEAVLKVSGPGSPHDTADAIKAILENVESRDGLTELIATDGLYQDEHSRIPTEGAIPQMMKHLRVTPMDANGTAFAIGFADSDPHRAQKVTQDLVARFMAENLNQNIRQRRGVTLQLLDPPKLPQSPIGPNKPFIAGLGFACFVLMWGSLSVMRWISARRHA